jgi:hypothetical protein
MFRFTLREIFDQQGSCSRLEAQQRIVALGATNMPTWPREQYFFSLKLSPVKA